MKGKIIGGILLVAGTTVGAGMLALPVLTCLGGFFPSLPLFLLGWIGTVYSAFLILEVNLWFKGEVNLVSMARKLLGRLGAGFTWLVYLLLLYSLTAAYIAGGGPLLAQLFHNYTGIALPQWAQPFPFLAVFGAFIYFGTRAVDLVNRLFMTGLIIAYIFLLALIAPHIDQTLILRSEYQYAWLAMPVVVASFGFQMIIPSLTAYLGRDIKVMKWVIWIGTTLPLCIYIFWEWAILGVVPVCGPCSLFQAFVDGRPATDPLARYVQHDGIALSAKIFAFFSVVTSFLGAALSLANFLTDGLQLKESFTGKLQCLLMTFAPPVVFVIFYPRGFVTALEYAGVFFAILLQILPALMVWRGRYSLYLTAHYRVIGGRFALILLMAYSCAVVAIEVVASKQMTAIAKEKACSTPVTPIDEAAAA